MRVDEGAKADDERRNVLVGVKFDSQSRELLNWTLVKVAQPGDRVIAVHACKTSGHDLEAKPLLDSYLDVYNGLCAMKKVDLEGRISVGASVRRALVKEAKNSSVAAVVVGLDNQGGLRGWASTARYCAKHLASTTEILCIHNGKIVYSRCNKNQPPGRKVNQKPNLGDYERPFPSDIQSGLGDSETNSEVSSYEILIRDQENGDLTDLTPRLSTLGRRSISLFPGDILDQRPGWPLLRRTSSSISKDQQGKKLSVVQWAMNLPDRSSMKRPQGGETAAERDRSHIAKILNASDSRWFSYKELEVATSGFHSDNLIGKGGSNLVYRGTLDGRPVAVRIQKASEEATKDFTLEVEIICSINHKHITPLLGACIGGSSLVSVFDYFSGGSLEGNLQGKDKKKSAMSWEVRYNVAVKVAEAINYLHSECSRPIIHRDIKSSNILLSDGLEPQLSDFGLAIWGPTTSSFLTHSDAVGTFGYLAPEYFMYGKVSNKIDVYAFGVVLLELLSGRKPICSETPKGQESLVMWAKPILESGNAEGILDPDLRGDIDKEKFNRMVVAAKLCITRAARIRPKMCEILKLLRGDGNIENWLSPPTKGGQALESQDDNDDEVYPSSSAELHLSLALLDVEDDSTSFGSSEQGNHLSLDEYLNGRWSRSLCFD